MTGAGHPLPIARGALFAALLLASSGALAQHEGHGGHPPEEEKADTETPTGGVPATATSSGDAAATDHGGMDHSGMDHSGMDHSGMDHSGMDHSGMDQSGMDHSGMDHAREDGTAASAVPRTAIPPVSDADRAAAFPDLHHPMTHGSADHWYLLLDRLEASEGDHGRGQAWEATGWWGGDIHRFWLRSEGERVEGSTESADLELLYGRAVSPWWDVVAGIRHDFAPAHARPWLALGVQGLAPHFFETQLTAYVGESGDTSVAAEVEYETLLTNRLILQWVAEARWNGQSDAGRGAGRGLATTETGARLRYEFTRKFAPYIGIVHERSHGATADVRRLDGEPVDDTRVVLGLRTWF